MVVELKEGVYWVGYVDWNIKKFHGHEYSTHRGTTYNCYLIIDDKVALVDTVWGPYSRQMIENIEKIIDVKKIDYVIANHAEVDHSGGLRTFVDEGATVVTQATNRAYYEQAWAAPHTLNPDRLAKSNKSATFETVTDRHVLTDGKRSIEIHEITGSGHNDAYLLVYLPTEGVVFESDAYTPAAANAPPPATPNPYSVNLSENIQRLKLNVKQIAAGHGPRLTTMGDLRAAITPRAAATN